MEIYADGRAIMRETGNEMQWGDVHPPRSLVEADIAEERSYVCEKDGEIAAVFYLSTDPDPTYAKIQGAWCDNAPYGVVHRIARSKSPNAKGAGAYCLQWCYEKIGNIRIDTHEANVPMRKLLESLGYVYCGIIWINIHGKPEERLAYHKT